MKLLFIENRYKTYLFEPIANQLSKRGHDIYWLIQNKQFLPVGNSKKYIIDYPPNNLNGYVKDESVEDVIKSDRQFNHFNKKDTSYFYYYDDNIKNYLKELKPNFVFGEATAFHELLTINNCKKQDILYLNPSTCRYPIGRFSFYKYSTLEPYLGSNETLSEEEANDIIDEIINRKTAPDYMKPSPVSKSQLIKDKAKKIYAYAKGEKFNTPNPIVKYQLEKSKTNNIKIWNYNAETRVLKDQSFKILYPLQMQPEANIDVWGKKYRDQTELIKNLAKSLPDNCVIYVKPNPKSKYELTTKLINLVENLPNIKHLHHATKMHDVLPHMDLVITVTGTIAIECILANKPVVTLVKTINNNAANCIYAEDFESLKKAFNLIETNNFPTISEDEKINFMNMLNRLSFKGVISDPYHDPNCVSKENIGKLVCAFENIVINDFVQS